MNPFYAFAYALFGVLCVWLVLRRAKQQNTRPRKSAWGALAAWYVSVGLGLSFTLVNLEGLHRQAAMVGGIATLAVAVILGLVVFRLSGTPARSAS